LHKTKYAFDRLCTTEATSLCKTAEFMSWITFPDNSNEHYQCSEGLFIAGILTMTNFDYFS